MKRNSGSGLEDHRSQATGMMPRGRSSLRVSSIMHARAAYERADLLHGLDPIGRTPSGAPFARRIAGTRSLGNGVRMAAISLGIAQRATLNRRKRVSIEKATPLKSRPGSMSGNVLAIKGSES